MIMIIGGAYAGKLSYAQNLIKDIKKEDWVDGDLAELAHLSEIKGIYGFHRLIRREMKKVEGDLSVLQWEEWAEQFADFMIEKAPDICLVTDEIGYGIVPMDKEERTFREVTGRICTRLAAYSKEVHRVVCGIGSRIK